MGRPPSGVGPDPGDARDGDALNRPQAPEDGLSPEEADPFALGQGLDRPAGRDLCPSGSDGPTVRTAVPSAGPPPPAPRPGATRDARSRTVPAVPGSRRGQGEAQPGRPRLPQAPGGGSRPFRSRAVPPEHEGAVPPEARCPGRARPRDPGSCPGPPAPGARVRAVPGYDPRDPVDARAAGVDGRPVRRPVHPGRG